MPKPYGLTAVKNLEGAFEHYNELPPLSALGYRSPREYLRRRASHGLSDKNCMEIWGHSKLSKLSVIIHIIIKLPCGNHYLRDNRPAYSHAIKLTGGRFSEIRLSGV